MTARHDACPKRRDCTPHACEAGGGKWPRCPVVETAPASEPVWKVSDRAMLAILDDQDRRFGLVVGDQLVVIGDGGGGDLACRMDRNFGGHTCVLTLGSRECDAGHGWFLAPGQLAPIPDSEAVA